MNTEETIVPVPASFLEHLLAALANQKFINEVNADGIAQGIDAVRSTQADIQRAIDKAYLDGWALLMQYSPKGEPSETLQPQENR